MDTQLAEAETKKVELDAKLVTLATLKEGKAPEVQQPDIPEPVIKTVEVRDFCRTKEMLDSF